MDSPIVVLAAPDHPLAGENNISLQCLAHEPWLMLEKGSGTRIAIERRFAELVAQAFLDYLLGRGEAAPVVASAR